MFRYNDPIDTVEQMRDSGLPFYIMDGTVMVWLAATDPRDVVRSINSEQGGPWLLFKSKHQIDYQTDSAMHPTIMCTKII